MAIDERSICVKRLLNHYKHRIDGIEMPTTNIITFRVQMFGEREPRFVFFEHNEGIDYILEYIRFLETKIDEFQYVQKIIDTAKREVENGNR